MLKEEAQMPFTVYASKGNEDFDKGKPYLVYSIRVDNKRTEFLVGNKNGDFVWHDIELFKEKQSNAI